MVGLLWSSLGMPVAGAEDDGQLRFAHLSPDTPAVDVAIAPLPPDRTGPLTDPGEDATTGLGYGAVSAPVDLPAGSYAVSVRAAGTGRTVPPALSARVDVPAGGARTVTLTGAFADLRVAALDDDLSAPPPGSARVRVLAAAGSVPSLDVTLSGGPALASALSFGAAAEPRTVPAGPATLLVGDAEPVPVSFAAGSVVTVLVLDQEDGGLVVRPVVDAAGPAVVPAGAVEAGTGDLRRGPAPLALALAATAGLAAAGRRGRVLLVATGLAAVTGVTTPALAVEPATTAPAHPAVAVAPVGFPAAPVHLSVPDAGVDAALTAAGLDPAGALVPPADAAVAGWYTGGPLPGLPGPAVIAGHVDWAGAPGVFSRIGDLRPGAEIVVGRVDGGTARFAVTRVVTRPKTDFPADEVYAPTAGAELRLITCGGSFDRAAGSYEDNVVVFAESVG
ncbi:class F sortase [Blastococcus sp. SYSU D00922]